MQNQLQNWQSFSRLWGFLPSTHPAWKQTSYIFSQGVVVGRLLGIVSSPFFFCLFWVLGEGSTHNTAMETCRRTPPCLPIGGRLVELGTVAFPGACLPAPPCPSGAPPPVSAVSQGIQPSASSSVPSLMGTAGWGQSARHPVPFLLTHQSGARLPRLPQPTPSFWEAQSSHSSSCPPTETGRQLTTARRPPPLGGSSFLPLPVQWENRNGSLGNGGHGMPVLLQPHCWEPPSGLGCPPRWEAAGTHREHSFPVPCPACLKLPRPPGQVPPPLWKTPAPAHTGQ